LAIPRACYIQRPTPCTGAAKQDRQVRPSPSGLALKVQHPNPG
jgi:translation initiation factor IF-3